MVTSVEKVEVLYESGRSRSYQVAVTFGQTAVVEFGLDPELGITVRRMYGAVLGDDKPVNWVPDKKNVKDKVHLADVEGRTVLMPMYLMHNGKDDVVSVMTSTGSCWVLDGGKYVPASTGSGSDFGAPAAAFDVHNDSARHGTVEKENEKVHDGPELG